MSWFSDTVRKASHWFDRNVIHPFGRLGGLDKYGNYSAWGLSPSSKSMKKEARQATREAEAEAQRRAHEEEVQSLALGGAEAIQNRRRRAGVYSTILTGGSPLAYASPPKGSGKTLLGQ